MRKDVYKRQAVYGAKGANGVMIITTKRGSVGKPKISIKAETGFTNFTKVPEMLSGVDYMMLYNESRRNSGLSEVYSREQILKTESGLDQMCIRDRDGSQTDASRSRALSARGIYPARKFIIPGLNQRL